MSINTFFLQIKMSDIIRFFSSKWKTYKFRFVPWIIFNARNNPSQKLATGSYKVTKDAQYDKIIHIILTVYIIGY